jgi:hypothetical protein
VSVLLTYAWYSCSQSRTVILGFILEARILERECPAQECYVDIIMSQVKYGGVIGFVSHVL